MGSVGDPYGTCSLRILKNPYEPKNSEDYFKDSKKYSGGHGAKHSPSSSSLVGPIGSQTLSQGL